MKRFLPAYLILLLIFCSVFPAGASAAASSSLQDAYALARSEADPATRDVVELIDIQEFEEYYGLSLDDDDILLMKIALMAYSNGAMLAHPSGISNLVMLTSEEYPFVGNMSSKKFHYSWCSSVSDIKDKNKKTFRTIDEAIAAGLKPCKRCNPVAEPD